MDFDELPTTAPDKEPRTKWDHIELWLSERFPTRMNEVTMKPEYQNEKGKWRSISDYWRNSILRMLRDETYDTGQVDENGKKIIKSMATTKAKLDEIINSDFSPTVDVFKEYFENLPEAHGHAAINRLAESVTIKDPDTEADDVLKPSELWPEYLRMWLVACVANFFNDEECENQTMLILIGKQNDGKTTWLNNLVPKALNPTYRFCSGLQDPRGKDAMTLLVSMFLVNIDDQLGSITKKDADGIKNLITMPKVTIRLPYDKYTNDHPHRASLCGSLNYTGFLTDPTGNRRYLPFELDSIEWKYLDPSNKKQYVDIDQVWAEAYALWKAKAPYKFANEQLKQLEEHNRSFMAPSTEADLIVKYLIKPVKWGVDAGNCLMTTTDIQTYLTECAGNGLKRPINPWTLKRELDRHGFMQKQRTYNGQARVRVYSVIQTNNHTATHGEMSYSEKQQVAHSQNGEEQVQMPIGEKPPF